MSRSPEHAPILQAAQTWKEQCLLRDGSLFSDKPLWRDDHLAILEEALGDSSGIGSYSERLKLQLENKDPLVIALMAEVSWLYYLFLSNREPKTKRNNILQIHSWSNQPSPKQHELLADEILKGIQSGGVSLNIRRPEELTYLLRVVRAFKTLPKVTQDEKINDPWQWSEWLEDQPHGKTRTMRPILQYLLFPDEFEQMVSNKDKVDILAAFTGKSKKQIKQMRAVAIEKEIYALRAEQEDKFGLGKLDFYQSPLLEIWKSTERGFLFSWRKDEFPWPSFESDLKLLREGSDVHLMWPCDEDSDIKTGSPAWINRKNQGILAAGHVTQAPFLGTHWNLSNKSETWYVRIKLTRIANSVNEPIIPNSALEKAKIPMPQAQWKALTEEETRALKVIELQRDIHPRLDKETAGQRPAINRIFYGPPGTGKTWKCEKQLYPKYEGIPKEMSQELLTSKIMSDMSWREVLVAALYDMGGHATNKELLDHDFVKAKKASSQNNTIDATLRGTLQRHCKDSEFARYAGSQAPLVFSKDKDANWCLAEDWQEWGTEPARSADKVRQGLPPGENIIRHKTVTFHQSYSYEDFVEGIRPVETEDGSVSYQIQKGIFRKICGEAKKDPDHRYALFIDEINRGNISKIFGELISLVEPDKRMQWAPETASWKGGLQIQLPCSKERFGVPSNLDIYGTMNTADRSIALMDTALRRRFSFEEVLPQSDVISGKDGSGHIEDGEDGSINLRSLLDALNQRISFLLHRDQTLGHAYFCKVQNMDDLRLVFLEKIIPLLQEYFYEDWRRIQWVFGDVDATGHLKEHSIIRHARRRVIDIFGIEPENLDDALVYTIAAVEEISPQSIRKIYGS